MSRWSKYKNNRPAPGCSYEATFVEHVANLITHGAPILPSLFGLIHLIHKAHSFEEEIISFIYGLATFALFSMSTLFHLICLCGHKKPIRTFFHIGDRVIIYLFIAASYTPWLFLRDYHDDWGVFSLFLVWAGALMGITYQYIFHERFKMIETICYLVVGIFPAYIVAFMHEQSGLYELAFGGGVYIVGTVFFKLDGVIPFAHAIWHCFVVVGAAVHYHAVDKYLIGSGKPHFLAWIFGTTNLE